MKVDTRWVEGQGYRPVSVEFIPTAPVLADRTLTFQFITRRFHGPIRQEDSVVQDIEIPAGSGPVRTTVSVPRMIAWSSYEINVFEDGKLLVPFRKSGGGNLFGWDWSQREALPNVLVVGDAQPDATELVRLFDAEYYALDRQPQTNSSLNRIGLSTLMARVQSELPKRWIDYTALNMVFLSADQLNGLKTRNPMALAAILEWTAGGGNLCVWGVDPSWQRLEELDSLLGLPPDDDREDDVLPRGWKRPDRSLFRKPIRNMGLNEDNNYGQYDEYPIVEDEPEQPKPKGPAPKPPKQDPFVFRELGTGMLVAMSTDTPFPGKTDHWEWLFNSLDSRRLLWCERHGVSAARENIDFWNFLIPGVGLAPVNAFRILITLFVVAIGPLNYLVLKRWKQLHLLVVTTPVSALAVTLLLFGYALFSDGLGTRVRVRSATVLDQRTGQAVCWSRLSYYAGLAPSDGLTFPADVEVVPFEFSPIGSESRGRDLIWVGDQHLVSGWIASRTPTQFITVRSRPSDLGLLIEAAAGATAGLPVTNRLRTPISQLLIRSRDGGYYWAADVGEDDRVEALPIDPAEAFSRLQKTHQQTAPEFPPAIGQLGSGSYFAGSSYGRRYGRGYGSAGQMSPPTQATGRLENAMAVLYPQLGGQAASLEPGSYVAVVERSPEVVLGTASAVEESSIHIIRGTW